MQMTALSVRWKGRVTNEGDHSVLAAVLRCTSLTQACRHYTKMSAFHGITQS